SQAIFDAVRPLAFALHCRPMDALRRHYGLPPLGPDLRRVYTDADLDLFCDLPEFYNAPPQIPGGAFIGPVQWSPPVSLPAWWAQIDGSRPIVYLTLGSSGDPGLLPRLVGALSRLDITLLVASAGAPVGPARDNVLHADYLPGDCVVDRADLVVCNGGSPTCGQAFAAGVPVLGIPGNLDQFLNMYYVERKGLGLTLRSTQLPDAVPTACHRILEDTAYRESARGVALLMERSSTAVRLREALAPLLA
ncbi:MAG TPA: glycosyltransferase, partial [Nitrospira sp.]|nr:glycosyltransferase [Nitrospira sp.]